MFSWKKKSDISREYISCTNLTIIACIKVKCKCKWKIISKYTPKKQPFTCIDLNSTWFYIDFTRKSMRSCIGFFQVYIDAHICWPFSPFVVSITHCALMAKKNMFSVSKSVFEEMWKCFLRVDISQWLGEKLIGFAFGPLVEETVGLLYNIP